MEKDEPPMMQWFVIGTFVVILVIIAFCMTQLLQGCVTLQHIDAHGHGQVGNKRSLRVVELPVMENEP